jgi:ATP-binding cassette subfamily B multidrug efflux pump
VRFYWHFVRQVPGLLGALFVTGFVVALLDAAIPVFMGRIVTLVTAHRRDDLA